jgi:hypothetical protein
LEKINHTSKPWNCPCVDHEVWRSLSDYCNCDSCKTIVGVKCDSCSAFNNPFAVPYSRENDITLCELCESKQEEGFKINTMNPEFKRSLR